MQPQQAGNKNPKTFAHLLASVTSGTDIESHYYEFKDKNELAQSLTSHNVQTLASMIEARPAAISAIWGIALCNATIGDELAPLLYSLSMAVGLTRIELCNLRMGDGCMAALARAIIPQLPHHFGLKMSTSWFCPKIASGTAASNNSLPLPTLRLMLISTQRASWCERHTPFLNSSALISGTTRSVRGVLRLWLQLFEPARCHRCGRLSLAAL